MLPKDIQDVRFSKAMSGYKADEVDDFCDKVYADYIKFAELIRIKQEKIDELEKKVQENFANAESINTVLISAQKLADATVADANAKAEEILSTANAESENIKQRTKKALEEIDAVITEQKNAAAKEAEDMLNDAARKSEGMILAAKDSVAREQLLFDKLKGEVAAFKKEIKDAYKAHLEALSALPEEVKVVPEEAAAKIEDIINNEPDLTQFVEPKRVVELEVVKPEAEDIVSATEDTIVVPDTEELTAAASLREIVSDMAAGFVVKSIDEE